MDLVHAADQAGLKVGKSHISQYVSGKTLPRAAVSYTHLSSDWSRDVNDRIADGRRIRVFKIHLYVYDRI